MRSFRDIYDVLFIIYLSICNGFLHRTSSKQMSFLSTTVFNSPPHHYANKLPLMCIFQYTLIENRLLLRRVAVKFASSLQSKLRLLQSVSLQLTICINVGH